jgi:lipid-A-disaccharide synthase
MTALAATPLFFLIAGEASGDVLGARLMAALRRKMGGAVRFAGIGGPRMCTEGLQPLFSYDELAHVGLVEIVRHVPHLLRRIRQTIDAVRDEPPAALITIDAPEFSFRVARAVKKFAPAVPLIHYVAPSVWAWRPGRAKKVARFLDHLLALLPFEPPYFTKEGLGCTFVGHPLIESGAADGEGARFRAKVGLADNAPLLAVLPGSRVSEVTRLLPVFRATVEKMRAAHPQLAVVMPLAQGVAARVRRAVADWPVPVFFTDSDADKYDALRAARVALACSGTVSIELALAGLPGVIAYKINPLTAALYRRLIRVKYATLVNIMKNAEAMPEFLQENCTPDRLASGLENLWTDTPARARQLEALGSVAAWLGAGQFVPSDRAAEIVLCLAAKGDRPC